MNKYSFLKDISSIKEDDQKYLDYRTFVLSNIDYAKIFVSNEFIIDRLSNSDASQSSISHSFFFAFNGTGAITPDMSILGAAPAKDNEIVLSAGSLIEKISKNKDFPKTKSQFISSVNPYLNKQYQLDITYQEHTIKTLPLSLTGVIFPRNDSSLETYEFDDYFTENNNLYCLENLSSSLDEFLYLPSGIIISNISNDEILPTINKLSSLNLYVGNAISQLVADSDFIIGLTKTIGTSLSLLFVVLSMILAFYVCSQSIKSYAKTIGILRSLGASKTNILLIFLIEFLILFLVVYILSIILSIVLTTLLNNYIIVDIRFRIQILTLTVSAIFSMAGVLMISIMIGTIIPSYKFLHGKIAKIMKEH